MTTPKNLGLRLLYADTEKEVSKIISSDSDMANADNWHPLDKRDTNFNIVTNQSSNGAKAATEIITNMVDAILTKRCMEKGIDPKSNEAPNTMYKAVDKFVDNLNGGKIIKADQSWLHKYAMKNLVIGTTGTKKASCYTFCDNGEGQHPRDFPATFLSLSEKNKSQIPFVQGKYNMGSSGVLNFCGEQWYKLILSRRYDKTGAWGWTLIRKRPEVDFVCADYFAIGGPDGIQTVNKAELYPFRTNGGREFEDFSLESGTIVKLYEYHMGKNVSFRTTREAFNENLVETILPFRLLHFSNKSQTGRGSLRARGIDDRPFYGMEFLVARTHTEEDEEAEVQIEDDSEKLRQIATVNHPKLGQITITVAVLKKVVQDVQWFKNLNYRIFHHVNGQAQFKQLRGFLTQCKFPALKDRVMIFVDASRLTDATHQTIWQGDRESITGNPTGELYKSVVKDAISGSSELKDLNHRIAREELDSVAKDSSRELVRSLVSRDKNLAALLDDSIPDVPVGELHRKEPTPRNDLKISPTYVKLKQKNLSFELPINRTRPIPCDTDAADDFFTRPENRGYPLFQNDDVANSFIVKYQLNNGELIFFMRPSDSVKVDDEFRFRIGLQDDGMPQPVYTEKELTIKIIKRAPRTPNPDPPPRDPPRSRAGLPGFKLVTKDGRKIDDYKTTVKWEDCPFPDFDKQDGGYVSDIGEGFVYYINYDNVWFQNYMRSEKEEDRRREVSKKYILGMRIAMLGMERAFDPKSTSEQIQESIEVSRRLTAKGASTVILTLCDQLPKSFDLFTDDNSDDE